MVGRENVPQRIAHAYRISRTEDNNLGTCRAHTIDQSVRRFALMCGSHHELLGDIEMTDPNIQRNIEQRGEVIEIRM